MILQPLIIEIAQNRSEIPLGLLELADPSRNRINNYLNGGQCFVAKLNSVVIGVMVLKELTSTTIEIKNIAIDEVFQGKGYGKRLLDYAEKISRESKYEKLLIGTGNSSINQIALYQKMGFEISEIRRDFFVNNYSEPIFENGIQCKHMVLLEKVLK